MWISVDNVVQVLCADEPGPEVDPQDRAAPAAVAAARESAVVELRSSCLQRRESQGLPEASSEAP